MPELAKKKKKVVKEVTPPKEEPKVVAAEKLSERQVIYPTFGVKVCIDPSGWDPDNQGLFAPPITLAQAMEMVGWETEDDYAKRVKGGSFGDDYLLKDGKGRKVRCWHNDGNRPFNEQHSRKLGQDVLNRNWAGPTTLPGETVNGETIILSRTGRVESAQHRLIGFILACEIWAESKPNSHWREMWPEEPVLESVVVTGVSENSKVVQTLDNVMPRSPADAFFTAGLFSDLGNVGKKECSRMLQKAVEFVWKRVRANRDTYGEVYPTNSAISDFVDRHKKILECVRFIFEENQERAISALSLSPGHCAGMLFLMGATRTDGDLYRNKLPLHQKNINWEDYDRACEFWVLLSQGSEDMTPIKDALGMLVDEDTGTGGRQIEKTGVIAKAWALFRESQPISEEEISLEYAEDEHGVTHLVDYPEYNGIDAGEPKKFQVDESPSPQQLEKEKARLRAERLKEKQDKVEAAKAKASKNGQKGA